VLAVGSALKSNGGFMDTNRIIADIETEISKLQQVRALLSNAAIRKGRPGGPKSPELSLKVTKPKKRTMSAKGRAAISAAMKARWAKARATKTVTKKPVTKSKS
jgi:hypothetical protein